MRSRAPPVKVALVGAANILNAAAGTPVPPAPSEVEVLPDPDPELPDPKSVEGEFARSLRMRSDRMGKRRDPL